MRRREPRQPAKLFRLWRQKGTPVTVCIASACNAAREVIIATDGMSTYNEITADVDLPKIMWFGDWTFMYSGGASSADLIFEQIRLDVTNDLSVLSREKIESTVRRAFKNYLAQWSVDRNLRPYNIEMGEFLSSGRAKFGEERFAELSRQIENDSIKFLEQVLVIGWGKSPHSVTMFEMNRDGMFSHSLAGIAAIGSGQNVAVSTLLSLGCGRNIPFEYTLYAVAAAKFAAENCEGVGEKTSMFVTRKRRDGDDPSRCPCTIVPEEKIAALREMWEKYSKPRIPDDALLKLHTISRELGYGGGMDIFAKFMEMMNKEQVKPSASEKSEPEQ